MKTLCHFCQWESKDSFCDEECETEYLNFNREKLN